jgi:hypothetical protein
MSVDRRGTGYGVNERREVNKRVVPKIEAGDYRQFRTMIKALPRDYEAWCDYHNMALAKRGADLHAQIVSPSQFREHMARRSPEPATIAQLFRCAADLAGLPERQPAPRRGGRPARKATAK